MPVKEFSLRPVRLMWRSIDYFWFVLCVVLIVVLGWKAVRFAYEWFIQEEEFTVIAPFRIAGTSDKANTEGLTLASALQAKLRRISAQQKSVSELLRARPAVLRAQQASPFPTAESEVTPQPSEQATIQVVRSTNVPVSLPVLNIPDFEAKIAGVEVGGIISWIYRTAAERGALQFAVAKGNGTAIVSGQLNRGGIFLYETVENNSDRIVSAVAFSIIRENLTSDFPEVRGLSWSDIEKLFETLTLLAEQQASSPSHARPLSDAKTRLAGLDPILTKAPRWRALWRISAELARQAREYDRAKYYIRRAMLLTDKRKEEDVLKSFQSDLVNINGSIGVEYAETLNEPGADVLKIYGEALALHKRLITSTLPTGRSGPRVAILGPAPLREKVDYEFEIVGQQAEEQHPSLAAYSDTLALIVKTISPNSRIIFSSTRVISPSGGLSIGSIVSMIDAALRAKADIILLTYGGGQASEVLNQVFQAALDKGCLAILPAGTTVPFGLGGNSPVAVIAATDLAGRTSGYRTPPRESWSGLLWAPGTQIPRLTETETWSIGAGASYAAAFAAGVAANLLIAGEAKPGADLLAKLRERARIVDPRDRGVRVISQQPREPGKALPSETHGAK